MEGVAVAGDLLADPNDRRLRFRQQPLEPRPTLDERQPAEVVVAFAQQIERDERYRLFAVDARDVVGVAQVNPTLQPLKSHRPPVAIEGDDLAIDDERFARGGAERRERFDNGRKLRRLVVAEPRPDAHRGGLARGCGFDLDERTNAVVFGFEDKRGAGQRRISERREHRSRTAGFFAPVHKFMTREEERERRDSRLPSIRRLTTQVGAGGGCPKSESAQSPNTL